MTGEVGGRIDKHRGNVAIAGALTAVACVYYFALLTNGGWNPFGTELCALVFNDMLAHLLRGDVTIDPAIIRGEAFIRNGHTITYWGIFPAFLRLPLIPIGALYELQIARLSCWIAVCGLASFLVATLVVVYRRSAPSAGKTLLFHILVVGTLFAGAVLTSLGSAYVYNEPVFWAAALSVAFNYMVLRRILVGAELRSRDLLVLAGIAGLVLNCRVLEGIGLYLATSWILFLALFAGTRGAASIRRVLGPAIVLAAFVAICGTVNYLRWGSPLTFMDLRLHVQIADNTHRLAVLNSFGEVNLLRLPFSISYYFLGRSWIDELQPLFGGLHDLYDQVEGPQSAFALTATVPLLLAGLGLRQIFRGRALLPSGGALVAGVLVAELVSIGFLLAADYLAMRYRMDFVPAMSFAAAQGYFFLTTKTVIPSRTVMGALLLTIVSIVASHVALVQYKEQGGPEREEARIFWEQYQCAKSPGNCSR